MGPHQGEEPVHSKPAQNATSNSHDTPTSDHPTGRWKADVVWRTRVRSLADGRRDQPDSAGWDPQEVWQSRVKRAES